MSAHPLGHIPEGVSMACGLRRMLLESRTLRRYQRTISLRVLDLLGSDPTLAKSQQSRLKRAALSALCLLPDSPLNPSQSFGRGVSSRVGAIDGCELMLSVRSARIQPTSL
jgi:hypothetical protein